MEELTIMLPIEQVTQELIMDLTETIKKHPGKALLKIEIHDPSEKNIIHFTSQSYTVHVDKEFYHWLKVKKSEGVLNFSNK